MQGNVEGEEQLTQTWVEEFHALYEKAVKAYENGVREAARLVSPAEAEFLASIGATQQEIFDFVEDWCDDREPDPDMVFRITKIRRDYFLLYQQGQPSSKIRTLDSFPSRESSMGGFVWFPRIIEKARGKLLGELPPDLMYSCAGDRRFLKQINMDPAEFLQLVWKAGDKVDRIVQFVTRRSKSSLPNL